MPPKSKKKRAKLQLDADSGQITGTDESKEKESASVRQVVEVVEEDPVTESLETIKKDVEEIEDAVEIVEEELEEKKTDDVSEVSEATEESNNDDDTKGSVESLFVKSTSPVTPDITVVGKRDKSLGVWIGATLGVVMAAGVSLLFLVNGPPSFLSFSQAAPTPTPTETPKPTPTTKAASLEREDITISVLNGGGVAGAGGKMKDFLESKGYVVDSVGNADEYTYTETVIAVKSGDDGIAKLLLDDLASDYTVSEEAETLDDDVTYDAQVIVGEE